MVTNIQKVSAVILGLCFCMTLVLLPGTFFFKNSDMYFLPLYCFLENEVRKISMKDDPETIELLIEKNAEYLSEQVQVENQEEAETLADNHAEETASSVLVHPHPLIDLSMERLADRDYFLNQFFILDKNVSLDGIQLDAANFLSKDLTLQKENSQPQILIYHSHSQEGFADSKEGVIEETVIGVGDYLAQILQEQYGYQVLHLTESFDLVNGVSDRSKAYDYARARLEEVLEEYPSIEVILDIHRDGVPEDRYLITEINGKKTAQIMFYNGLSYTSDGPVSYLPNQYIQDNLAFSFQLEYQAAQYYPEFYRGIYLAGLRYNLHLRPRSLLLEVGAQTNTLEEAKNAMEPFADILNRVLEGEKQNGGSEAG